MLGFQHNLEGIGGELAPEPEKLVRQTIDKLLARVGTLVSVITEARVLPGSQECCAPTCRV